MKKVLIIGFLFGVIIPFYFTMVTGSRLLVAPGLYFSTPFTQQTPTQFSDDLDSFSRNNPGIDIEQVKRENEKFLAEHPTTSSSNSLSWTVFFVTNGIFYAFIFWTIYFVGRKLRNKKPIQIS